MLFMSIAQHMHIMFWQSGHIHQLVHYFKEPSSEHLSDNAWM